MARRARWRDRIGAAIAAALVASAVVACAPVGPSGVDAARSTPDARELRLADFDRFCTFVAERYAYFGRRKTDWPATCADARPRAAAAVDRDAFVLVVERTLDALYDFHAHVGTSNAGSRRLVPTDSDVHARWRDARAIVVDVRAQSAARTAGLRTGMEVVAIDGVPVADAIAADAPARLASADPAANDFALDAALAGRQDGRPVTLDVVAGAGATQHRSTLRFVPHRERADGAVSAHCERDVGVIAFNNSLGDTATIAAYDAALGSLPCRRGLVIDLRDTPSGGTSTVARGVIGRLVRAPAPYQRHELVSEFRETGVRRIWVEYVEPRDPVPSRPVVVLVGHWTGSVGEGLAIGLDAAVGARVVGRRMAGLLGALDEVRLPHAGFVVRIPTERLSHVDGTPREDFLPCPVPGDPVDDAAQLAYAVRVALMSPASRGARTAGSCPRPARR